MGSLPSTKTITLPDCLTAWPFKRAINPAYAIAASETRNWIRSFKNVNQKALLTAEKTNGPLVAALMYPNASAEHLRIISDLMDLYFIYDDITDAQNAKDVEKLSELVMDALRYPDKEAFDTEDFLVEMFRSFGSRLQTTASTTITERFLQHYDEYTSAVCQEAKDRDESRIRDFGSYVAVRRGTIGTHPCYDLLLLSSEVSQNVLYDPRIVELESLATSMVLLLNDILSYNVEQSRGEDLHNAVYLLMHSKQLSVQEAIDIVGDLVQSDANRFIAIMNSLPWNDDKAVQAYVHGLGNWVTGLYEWSFEIKRYRLGPEQRRTGIVELLPKRL